MPAVTLACLFLLGFLCSVRAASAEYLFVFFLIKKNYGKNIKFTMLTIFRCMVQWLRILTFLGNRFLELFPLVYCVSFMAM